MKYLTEERFDKKFDEFNRGLDARLDARIEQKIDERFEQFINGPFADVKFEINEIKASLARVEEKFDYKFNSIMDKIDGIMQKIDNYHSESSMVHVRIDRLEQYVGFSP